ncbi:TPA: hypothetical protein BOS_23666 [Bos taurus]|nr:TPA: hypothetical protein BOS_23666 [Bos taurus]
MYTPSRGQQANESPPSHMAALAEADDLSHVALTLRDDTQHSSLKFNLILFLLISTMHMFWCHPISSSKVPGKSDYFVILLNSCPTRMDRRVGLDFLKPILEKTLMKRSFRNGVGTGMKKTSFRRAKS